MSLSGETPRENLTLTEADLAACRPIVGEGGHVLRALCPFHGSDRQRSLRVQVHSGRFVCFACGAWGYMETARAQWREEQQRRRPCRGLLPAGSACHTAASRHRGFPGRQRQQPGNLRQIPQHRVRLLQLALTWLSSSRPSRRLCQAAAAKRTCSSAAFPWPWRSSTVWAMRRRAPGRMPHGIGAAAAWSFRIRRRTGAS